MSIAAIWDRFWWSLMLAILIGLIWLKFIDPLFPHIIVGIIISCAAGGTYFTIGIRKMLRVIEDEKEIERKAREELIAEYGKEAVRD